MRKEDASWIGEPPGSPPKARHGLASAEAEGGGKHEGGLLLMVLLMQLISLAPC